jgi:hypothetical protein
MPSKTKLKELLENRWVAILLLASLAVLLAMVATDLGRKLPHLPRLNYESTLPSDAIPVSRIEKLVSSSETAKWGIVANHQHAFYTKYFEPLPAPPPATVPAPAPALEPVKPSPPPTPVTMKVPLIYQGVYQTSDGQKKAFVMLEKKLSVLSPGTKVVADWSIAEISLRTLTLTNSAAQTNILPFNSSKELEIPVK